MRFFRRLSIDLGTTNSLIYDLDQGMLLQEPSVVAYQSESERVIAWGHKAELLRGRSTKAVTIERPIKDGVVVSPDGAYLMLSHFIKEALGRTPLLAPKVIACVPTGATAIERRALRETIEMCGVKLMYLIDEPIAAAIGAGLSLTEPIGRTVIDIGGGTCEIAVMSMTGLVFSESIDTAGDDLTNVIQRYVKQEHQMLIGFHCAEIIKHNIGSVHPEAGCDDKEMVVSGTSVVSSMPKTITLCGAEIREVLASEIQDMILMIGQILEQLPPELAADVAQLGMTLVGGGALLNGLAQLVYEKFQVPVSIPMEPINCVVLGAGEAMANPKKYSYFL